jgi:cation/acetate symporter
MATPSSERSSGDFVSNLGKIYGYYTGGFFGFVILLAILEQIGVPNYIIGYLFVFLTLAVYAVIGVLSRTMQVSEYYVAGRRVPALYNGMATGAATVRQIRNALERAGAEFPDQNTVRFPPTSW